MSLKDQLNADIKTAMKAGEKSRLVVLRMISAAIKQREIDERIELNDSDVLAVVEKMLKQRRESEKVFREGNRDDLADKEAAEIEIVSAYMPEQLSDDELATLIDDAISSTGASSIRDMGKVMGIIKSKAQGRADIGKVSGLIKARLNS
ncbi:MAG: GatB/YqeY domain-containing protein [Pseudomonadota bacterium]